jgi:hypothetical protein
MAKNLNPGKKSQIRNTGKKLQYCGLSGSETGYDLSDAALKQGQVKNFFLHLCIILITYVIKCTYSGAGKLVKLFDRKYVPGTT